MMIVHEYKHVSRRNTDTKEARMSSYTRARPIDTAECDLEPLLGRGL